MRKAIAVLIGALALTSTASASADTTLAVTNPAAVPAAALNRAEHAITKQVNASLHRAWRTPPIQFTSDPASADIVINFDTTQRQLLHACNGEEVEGCHWVSNQYGVEVQTDPQAWIWTSALDHEIIETLVDPNTTGREVCDPVEDNTYELDGVTLSDFVWPGYYNSLSFGPMDQMGLYVRHNTAYGHIMRGF